MGGDPGFFIFVGLFGFPPLALWVLGGIQMITGGFSPSFAKLSISQKLTAFLCLLLVMAFSAGCIWFIRVFAQELQIQLTCSGASCAQTGLFFFMYVPVPWISFVLAWATASQFIEEGALPLRRKPNFSLKSEPPSGGSVPIS
jgi:hypothetical protein